jgi:hypothetical protein
MKVVTRRLIKKPPEEIWGLLLNSNVDRAFYCPVFCLGTPRPLRCEYTVGDLAASESKRRCVSDKGSIEQQIDTFEPPRKLRFHMVETDLSVRVCISDMADEFRLASGEDGTVVERTTLLNIKGPFRNCKAFFMWFGIKSIHKYVFDAWASQKQVA